MSLYGSTIPRKGRELFAKILATSKPLTITRVMMGQGICPDTIFPGDLARGGWYLQHPYL